MENIKNICCCDALWTSVDKAELLYDPVLKWFGCYIKGVEYEETGDPSVQIMRFCPFCGEKLPNLGSIYLDTIENELGKEAIPKDWFPESRSHLPPEFQTDKWWRKRGL